MLAAEQGSLEIVQELIRRGANVNLDDVVSETSALSPMRKKNPPPSSGAMVARRQVGKLASSCFHGNLVCVYFRTAGRL